MHAQEVRCALGTGVYVGKWGASQDEALPGGCAPPSRPLGGGREQCVNGDPETPKLPPPSPAPVRPTLPRKILTLSSGSDTV